MRRFVPSSLRTLGSAGSNPRGRKRRRALAFRGLQFEPLEVRHLLAASINDLHVLNDTGSSSTDLVTSEPQVTGIVQGDFSGGHVEVEFDHYGDGNTDGYIYVSYPGEQFTYDPRYYDSSVSQHSGSFSLNYRAVEYDASYTATYGEWQLFSLVIAQPEIFVAADLDGYTYVVEQGMGWVNYGATTSGEPLDTTFTITNTGQEALTLDVGSLTVPYGFSVPSVFATSVSPGQSTSLVIRLDATSENYFGGTVSFVNNDPNAGDFDFYVEGSVASPAPEIAVSTDDYGWPYGVQSGSDWIYFDTTSVGVPIGKTFTIENTGTGDLILDSVSLNLPSGFTATSCFDSTVSPTGSTTFTIQLDAAEPGYHSGLVSFSTNDSDENPFQFYIAGDVAPLASPELVVLDNQWLEIPDGTGSGQVSFATNDATENPFNFTLTGNVAGPSNSPPFVVGPIADFTVGEDAPTVAIDLGPVFDDPDFAAGDVLRFLIADNGAPAIVAASITAAQISLAFSPNASGTATIRVQAGDLAGATVEDEFVVNVLPDNDVPTRTPDDYQVLHDVAFGANVLDNDRDPDGDALTAMLASAPQHGTLDLASDGSFIYTPQPGFLGQDLFTYKVSDGTVETVAGPVEITVYNRGPVAAADAFTTGRNLTLSAPAPGILGNDVDLDGEPLGLTLVSDVAHGVLRLNADGGFVYAPVTGFVGLDSFTYFVSDGLASSDVVTANIDVVNNAPRAGGDSFSVLAEETLSVTGEELLLNDYDFDGDALSAIVVQDVGHGSLQFNADGSFTYAPAAGFVGFDTLHYRLSDGMDSSEPAVVFLEVNNARPRAENRTHRLGHDGTLTVAADAGLLAWARDPDDQTLSVVLVSGPAHGQLTVEPDGGFTYVPSPSFVGIDAFAYRISDGVDQSDTALVKLEVVNTAPAATDDMFLLLPDEPLTVDTPGLLLNDVDADADSLTIQLDGDVEHGTLTLQADGSLMYVPDAGFFGIDSFTYRVTDGIRSVYATAQLHVLGAGLSPASSPHAAGDHYQVVHGRTLFIGHTQGVLANDYHPQGNWLDAVLVDSPTQGALLLAADGSFTYTPTDAQYVGSDSFTYKATDGSEETAVVTVDIDIINSAPTAATATFDVHQGQSLAAPGLGLMEFIADADEDELTVSVVSNVSNGTLVLEADGTLTYTPNESFVGIDTFIFIYVVNDGAVDSNTGTVTIDITNSAPTASPLTYHVLHDTMLDTGGVGVLSGASDADGDMLTVELVTAPAHGTLALAEDGTFTYTPDGNFTGTDGFTFQAKDGAQTGPPTAVTIDVLNDIPAAVGAEHNVHHADTLSRRLEAWDPDADDITYHVTDNVDHGTLTVGADGLFTYAPDLEHAALGPFTDEFKYKVNDGVADSDEATVTLHVTNTKPVAIDLTYKIHAGASLGFLAPGLLDRTWDANGDALVVVGGVSGPLSYGQLTVGADGAWAYTSSGTSQGTETFTYQVHDGAQASDSATVTIHVHNEPPRAYDQVFDFHHLQGSVVGSQRTFCFDLSRTGYVVDPDEDPVTVAAVSLPDGVTIAPDGTGSVTVSANFVGEISFEYVARDRIEDGLPATVTIEIGNTEPRGLNDYLAMKSGGLLILEAGDLLRNDFDMDGDPLTLGALGSPSNGTLVYDGQLAAYEYDPGSFVGTATITYEVSDRAATSHRPPSTSTWSIAPRLRWAALCRCTWTNR